MLRLVSLVVLTVLASSPSRAQNRDRDASRILVQGKAWDLLGQGYQLTADSAVDKDGNVYFTDARRNRIMKIDLAGKISLWKENSNGAHGVAYAPDGRVYAGQHDRKRIVAFSNSGTESVVAEGVQTHHFTVTARNEIYFTVAPSRTVSILDAAGRVRVVHEGLRWPRGVRVSTNRSLLAVNDAQSKFIWTFQIQADGSLINGRPFYSLESSDEAADGGGLAFDSEGFLYVATKIGVQAFDQQGRLTAIIGSPDSEGVSDVFFGGPGLQWLYVTDGDRIYRRPVQRRGVSLPASRP
jgi:gluconolactonase